MIIADYIKSTNNLKQISLFLKKSKFLFYMVKLKNNQINMIVADKHKNVINIFDNIKSSDIKEFIENYILKHKQTNKKSLTSSSKANKKKHKGFRNEKELKDVVLLFTIYQQLKIMLLEEKIIIFNKETNAYYFNKDKDDYKDLTKDYALFLYNLLNNLFKFLIRNGINGESIKYHQVRDLYEKLVTKWIIEEKYLYPLVFLLELLELWSATKNKMVVFYTDMQIIDEIFDTLYKKEEKRLKNRNNEEELNILYYSDKLATLYYQDLYGGDRILSKKESKDLLQNIFKKDKGYG